MNDLNDEWALILGSSSGFGEATARELASRGVNIVGVHFDRKSEMDRVNALIGELEDEGSEVVFFNENAAREQTREMVVEELLERMDDGRPIRLMMHSLAFGTLKKYVTDNEDEETISSKQMDMTMDVMAHTLVYWTQAVYNAGLLQEGSRIFAMTSAGGHTAWPYYGAVSSAKASLEAHMRQLAAEMAEEGVTVNCIQAGVTDTPALRKIPEFERMIEKATERNPTGRMTTPQDVANAIALLSHEESQFITGNVIRCDGGEDIVR